VFSEASSLAAAVVQAFLHDCCRSAQPLLVDDGVLCMTQAASGPAVEGVCGYGDVSQTLFPRMNVASVSAVNPGRVCGSCIQIRCLQVWPSIPACSCRTAQCANWCRLDALGLNITISKACVVTLALLIPAQKNCTTTRPFIVQVVDNCGTGCSPNELQLPVETYTSSLVPANVSQVLVQYRVVRP
jgi:hypothetical protein